MFTLKLESDLRDQFMAEAAAAHRPASQIVREFMRDFVQRKQKVRDHDQWFRAEVEQAVREADDPSVARLSNDEVAADWRELRAALVARADNAKA
jgi:predicted transcriptional regulator